MSKLTDSVESAYLNDAKYRQYSSAVEKALKAFEYTSEWADLISALGKLNKLIQANSKYGCVPKAVTVSKRLSQCMHPALPFGVHLKALECYKQIFDCLGTVNLSRDLCLYAIGLFPLYANATIHVRRSLLELYEKYFIAMGPLLRPALTGFLNGLLPGLEENSDFFDRLIDLLNQIEVAVGTLWFYSCLWECVYCASAVRFPALLYVTNHLDRKRSVDDQLHIVGASIDRMVDALCASGGDSNVYVQRQLLDFVIVAFPINSHNLLRSDMIRLVQSCVFVVLKRDMSLNRRFFSWLLGPSGDPEYFNEISKPLLVDGVTNLLADRSRSAITIDIPTKLLRSLLYLLDRPEIGKPLVIDLLEPVLLEFVRRRPNADLARTNAENFAKVFSLLLDALKPGFVWEYLCERIQSSVDQCLSPTVTPDQFAKLYSYLDIIDLLLSNKDLLSHSDTNGHCMSSFLVHLLQRLTSSLKSNHTNEQLTLINRYLTISSQVFEGIQRISAPVDLSLMAEQLEASSSNDLKSSESHSIIVDVQACMENCRRAAVSAFSAFARLQVKAQPNAVAIDTLSIICTFLKSLADFPIYCFSEATDDENDDRDMAPWVEDLKKLCFSGDFDVMRQAVDCLLHVYALCKSIIEQRRLATEAAHRRETAEKPAPLSITLKPLLPEQCQCNAGFLKELAATLWDQLSPSNYGCYDETCRLLLFLHSIDVTPGKDNYGDSVCASLILDKMLIGDQVVKTENIRRFCVLWSLGRRYLSTVFLPGYPCRPFIRPALLLVDCIQTESTVGHFAHRWYDDCLDHGDVPTLLDAFCTSLAHSSTARVSIQSVRATGLGGDDKSMHVYRLTSSAGATLFHRYQENNKASLTESTKSSSAAGHSIAENTVRDSVESTANDYEDSIEEETLELETTPDEATQPPTNETDEVDSASSACSAATTLANGDDGGNSSSVLSGIRSQHAHVLLYRNQFDARVATHAFRSMLRMMVYSPRRFVETLLSCSAPMGQNSELSALLSSHSRSLIGHEFFDSETGNAGGRLSSASMYFETLLTLSLFFLRSYFVDDPSQKITAKELQKNWTLKMSAMEFLTNVMRLVGDICDEAGRSVAAYVADVMARCKFQKCVLHCLMAHDCFTDGERLFSDSVITFNAKDVPNSACVLLAYENHLLNLLESVIQLEYRIRNAKADFSASGIILEKLSVNNQVSPAHAARQATPVCAQKLFLIALLNALKRNAYCSHMSWLRLVVRCLSYLEKALPTVLLHVCEQLCKNLELGSQFYLKSENDEISAVQSIDNNNDSSLMPVNYITNVLEIMTALCHFAILDSPNGFLPSSTHSGASLTIEQPPASGGKVTGEVFGNLARVFAFGDVTQAAFVSKDISEKNGGFIISARQELLAALPHMLSTLCGLWGAVKPDREPSIPVGSSPQVRRLILALLSPLAVNQIGHFLSALALVWLTRSSDEHKNGNTCSETQLELIDLLLSIKMLPFEKLVAGVLQTLKQPVRTKNTEGKDAFPLELSLLEMVAAVQNTVKPSVLTSSWSPLQQLVVDGLNTVSLPTSRFILLKIFSHYVTKVQSMDDKSVRKEAQDTCQKLVESINDVVGWHLEQPSWLKRTINVKQDAVDEDEETTCENTSNGVYVNNNNNKHSAVWSAKALVIFAEHLSTVLDFLYKNEEKDRMVALLTNVWTNVLPYLKTRSRSCRRHFSFASKLLARLSQYSQTRVVWKKATMDLVVEPAFFRCPDVETLRQWSVIIDNLMTQDKTSFKEFMAKTAISQSAGIFTSRDQEYESRSQALKRLAFVILSSDVDQYQSYLPDIQERLVENLRLYQVPHVYADVFLCFRSLLIRLSSQHLLPLWPTMVSETVQVLLQIEQEFSDGGIQIDDYKCARDDQWMLLYFAAAKFLETLCKLPSSKLPQFQMYQWVFTKCLSVDDHLKTDNYFSHVERINSLMAEKYGSCKKTTDDCWATVPELKPAKSLRDLQPFFTLLCDGDYLHSQAMSVAKEVEKEIEDGLYREMLLEF